MNSAAPVYVSENEVFWGEIAATEHILHLYGDEHAFFGMLEGFVGGGLGADEGVIVIATTAHRNILNRRLEERGFDLRAAREKSRYLDVDVDECLAVFMKDGWPDEALFNEAVMNLIGQVKLPGHRVRAFGEMVAILWDKGYNGATVRLEHLWNELRGKQPFSLFCSYPKAGFTAGMEESLKQICDAHTKVIANHPGSHARKAG